MKEQPEWPLLRGERRVRFVCGFLVGLLVGFEIASRSGLGRGGTFF